MFKLRVHNFAISLDGYGAGPNQGLDNPLGVGGLALHNWIIPTRTFQQMEGKEGGETGVDDEFMARGFANIGAWIVGRNMFGPRLSDKAKVERDQKEDEVDYGTHAAELWRLNDAGA